MRLFNLIIKMRELVLDFDKISIYKFEKFYTAQYRIFAKQFGQAVDEPTSPKNPNRRTGARRLVDPAQQLANKLGIAQNTTFTRSFKCIEGYLGKEVESKRYVKNS